MLWYPAEGQGYLPVSKIAASANLALVELPQEAETGACRIWIKADALKEIPSAVAGNGN